MGDNPSHWRGKDLPVEGVSWKDCQEFCRQLGERLGKSAQLPTG
ncbi:formylglycine-generating enzyme family protein, partial [Lacticaseibacillus rhamnosus]